MKHGKEKNYESTMKTYSVFIFPIPTDIVCIATPNLWAFSSILFNVIWKFRSFTKNYSPTFHWVRRDHRQMKFIYAVPSMLTLNNPTVLDNEGKNVNVVGRTVNFFNKIWMKLTTFNIEVVPSKLKYTIVEVSVTHPKLILN